MIFEGLNNHDMPSLRPRRLARARALRAALRVAVAALVVGVAVFALLTLTP